MLSQLPDDGCVYEQLKKFDSTSDENEGDGDADGIDESFVPQNLILDQKQKIAEELELPYPSLTTVPINEFTKDSGYITKAFPCLFPYGNADFTQTRDIQLTQNAYFEYLMQYHDQRFAQDPRFRYFALNTLMRHQILGKGHLYEKDNAFGDKTLPEIQNELLNNDKSFNNLMSYIKDMRSTKPYWKQRCNELLAMVDQLGKPTTFFTLSAADYYWPDLYRLLKPNVDPASLSMEEKRELMHKNPHIVSYFFQERCHKFLTTVLKPILKIKDFWFRFEWQARGSGHIHGVIWHEDAPAFEEDTLTEDMTEVVKNYFDQFCSALNPSFENARDHPCEKRFSDIPLEEKDHDLIVLINKVQRHTKHGQHCLKFDSSVNKLTCRFKFPKPIRDQSEITNNHGYKTFEPMRNDQYMQRYNGYLISVWRANIDFSPNISLNAVLQYIAKYASKAEISSKAYTETLREIVRNLPHNRNYKTLVTKTLLSVIGERDYSAQEIFHILMGWPMYRSSRIFVTLCIYNDSWNSFKPNKNYGISRGKSMIQKYKERPDELENLSLLDFAKSWYVSNSVYKKSKTEAVCRIYPQFQLSGHFDEDENYFKMQCILNIPFRGTFENILLERPQYASWNELFLRSQLPVCNHYDLPTLEDEGILLQGLDNETQVGVFEVLSSFIEDNPNQLLGERLMDKSYKWSTEGISCPTLREVTDFLKHYQDTDVIRSTATFRPTNFSPDQELILQHLDRQITAIANGDHTDIMKRCIIQGKAGSGKSTVINEMRRRIIEKFGSNSVYVAAPTGSAAVNVEGSTVHSLLNIYGSNYTPLKGKAAQTFQDTLRNLKILVIDEMSLVGARLLYQIDKRCRELFPNVDEPFGGLYIYFLGDYRQLPPTLDTAVYATEANSAVATEGLLIFKSFQIYFELTTNHRQRNDRVFGDLLHRIADGNITVEDYQLLQTRTRANVSDKDFEPFKMAIHLFPTNSLVETKNTDILRDRNQPVARILAANSLDILTSVRNDQDLSLSPVLYLALNCRVMLRSNLWVAGKLINGSLGTVKYIVYKAGSNPPDLPLYVLVEFDHYKGPYIYEKCFPIIPTSKSIQVRGTYYTRKQLPLLLGHAFTIHKAQGLTLDKVVVDIGTDEKQLGRSYVALSRCRQLSDMVIYNLGPRSRFNNIRSSTNFQNRFKFLMQFNNKI